MSFITKCRLDSQLHVNVYDFRLTLCITHLIMHPSVVTRDVHGRHTRRSQMSGILSGEPLRHRRVQNNLPRLSCCRPHRHRNIRRRRPQRRNRRRHRNRHCLSGRHRFRRRCRCRRRRSQCRRTLTWRHSRRSRWRRRHHGRNDLRRRRRRRLPRGCWRRRRNSGYRASRHRRPFRFCFFNWWLFLLSGGRSFRRSG